jgi:hypothetical protein
MTDYDEVYEKLFENVVIKERMIKLKLINVQQKLLDVLIFKVDLSCIRIDIWNNNKNLTTISFDYQSCEQIEKEKMFKDIFRLIEESYYCNQKFCNQYVVDANDLIDDMCIQCFVKNNNPVTLKEECSICLDYNNLKSVVLNCSHIFHKECLYKTKTKNCLRHIHICCPMCREKTKLNLNMEEVYSESEDEND